MKTVGIASAVGVASFGSLYLANKWGFLGSSDSSDGILAKMRDAEEKGEKHPLFLYLSPSASVALQEDYELSDLCERLFPYFKHDEAAGQAFVEAAAAAAEYKLRMSEIKHKKSIPVQFGVFTRSMVMNCRALRKGLRDSNPSMLEEFDELVEEVVTYKNDNHHNMWCSAHD